MSPRLRLTLTLSGLFAVALIISALWLAETLRLEIRAGAVTELQTLVRSAEHGLENIPPDASPEQLESWTHSFGRASGARLTMIDPQGQVVADSRLGTEELASIENHGQRPEVVRAHTSDFGGAWRYSSTVHQHMVYVARSVRVSKRNGVTLRVGRSQEWVRERVTANRIKVAWATLLAILLASVMGWFAAGAMRRELRRVQHKLNKVGARATADGNWNGKGQEVRFIESTIERMAIELDHSLETLVAERDRMSDVLEGMGAAVLATDPHRRVVLANHAAVELFCPGSEAVGRTLAEVIRVPDVHDVLREQMGPSGALLEFEILGDKHRYCVGRITRQPATKGLLLVIHDMTALRQLETVRRDFVANVSHELRTPVSVIQANVETLLDGALDDPAAAREFTEGIDRSTQRLALLLDDLLDLAKLEARGVELRADAIDAHTAAQSVVDFLTPKAHEKKQTLELKVPDGLRLRADPLALEQILINLIDNALKYTPAGGTIVVHASLQPDTVRFEVRDNGRGIAPDMRERVFERFFRVDPGRAAHMGGTGLGLSIVKHFVTQMKGVIGVEPRTGGGSTFFFELPRDATPPTVTPS